MTLLQPFLAFTARLGSSPDDSPELATKKQIMAIALLSSPIPSLGWTLIFYLSHEYLVVAIYLISIVAGNIGLIMLATHPKGYQIAGTIIVIEMMTMGPLITLVLGGLPNAAGQIFWILLCPLAGLVLYDVRTATRLFTICMIIVAATALAQPWLRSSNNVSMIAQVVLYCGSVLSVVGYAFLTLRLFLGQRDQALALLSTEQQKAEALLLNILPADIAQILKNEQRTIAEDFGEASILFADIVNFTPLSASMTPVELVRLLNEVFSYFDQLVEKYGLEKIKTIGDCYMVASGVPRRRADHAQALARMALEIRDYVASHTFAGGRHIDFRIGINSGSVVAGVIGQKKFIYDLWGDAVNTASRMESHGNSGAIQITDATYGLLRDEFECESRGVINVKGKGEMQVWLLNGAKVGQTLAV